MALHNIKIIVVDGGRSGSYKSKTRSTSEDESNKTDWQKSPIYKLINLKSEIKNKITGGTKTNPQGVMMFNMATQLSKQIITQTANYYFSDIGRKNGDSNYQQIINRNIEIAFDIGKFLTSAASGAATGSMFGPMGAAVGAAAGFTSSLMSLQFRNLERQRTHQHEIFKENNSQTYNLARTSYQGFTGRLR